MPIRAHIDNSPNPPRFDLLRGEETCGYEDGNFVPHLPGVSVGDLVSIGDYISVYRIVREDERGHEIEFSHRLPEPEFVR